jgi:hypothetical protein
MPIAQVQAMLIEHAISHWHDHFVYSGEVSGDSLPYVFMLELFERAWFHAVQCSVLLLWSCKILPIGKPYLLICPPMELETFRNISSFNIWNGRVPQI